MKRIKAIGTMMVLLLSLLVCSTPLFSQNTDDPHIRIDTVLLNVPVIVSDSKGRRIQGLSKDNFSVFQGNEKLQIDFFANVDNSMSVAIVVDTSASTMIDLEKIKKSAKLFLDTFTDSDLGLIASFDYDERVLCSLTSDRTKLRNGIGRLTTTPIPVAEAPRGERGRLFDVIHRVLTKEFANVKGRKAIVVLTDGLEYGTKISFDVVATAVAETDVPIYLILFPSPGAASFFPPGTKSVSRAQYLSLIGTNSVNSLVESSGGSVYFASLDILSNVFASISEELKKQYVIAFYPLTSGEKTTPLPISIQVDYKGAVVRTRKDIRVKSPTSQ